MKTVSEFDYLDWSIVFVPTFISWLSWCLPGRKMDYHPQTRNVSPPGIVYGIAWTTLFILNGFAWAFSGARKPETIVLYLTLSILFLLWTPLFKVNQVYALYLLYLCRLVTFFAYTYGNQNAKLCLVPLITWLSFASKLNYTIALF
jgi:tryptophan-rich sensory protein